MITFFNDFIPIHDTVVNFSFSSQFAGLGQRYKKKYLNRMQFLFNWLLRKNIFKLLFLRKLYSVVITAHGKRNLAT
jgi:hypothetical protein